MNILSDFGKDKQVKKVALKTGISGKNSAISSPQIIIFLVPLVLLIIINSFFSHFEGGMFNVLTGSFCHTWHDRVSK